MKQIVPFTKKISFDTTVDEITSISLDKTIKSIEDSIISGVFDLYLEYKESDISINVLKYTSSIPFDIDIDSKYSLKDVKIDIDDFYYEIEDDNVVLHIDLLVDNLEYAKEELENIITKHVDREETTEALDKKENIKSDDKEEVTDEVVDRKIEEIKPSDKEEKEDVRFPVKEEPSKIEEENNIKSSNERDDSQIKIEDLFKEIDEKIVDVDVKPKKPIFETFDPKNETYVTYNVHIVREEDNVETICLKYGVTKEELSYYNDISMIKLGDKLIVPTYKK